MLGFLGGSVSWVSCLPWVVVLKESWSDMRLCDIVGWGYGGGYITSIGAVGYLRRLRWVGLYVQFDLRE
jgi:hypothetical protein